MTKALNFYLNTHNIQQSVDLVEDNIARGYDENIVIHHKQDLCFLTAIRNKKIGDDDTALLNYVASKELSRCYRILDKFNEHGNVEGRDLIVEEINFLYCFLAGGIRWNNNDTSKIRSEYQAKHPERIAGEINRNKNGIVSRRKPENVFTIY